MNTSDFNRSFFSFLDSSPTPYHAVKNMSEIFKGVGMQKVEEKDEISFRIDQPSYFIREDGSLVAFNVGHTKEKGFRILGSHSDSPCLKIKAKPDITENTYHKLGIEVYGGALLNPWFDRELSIAGRVTFSNGDNKGFSTLINFASPVGIIPSLAIHFDRQANNEKKINPQKDIIPIIGLKYDEDCCFSDILLNYLKKNKPHLSPQFILDYDLFFYDCNPARYSGFNDEFIGSSRLDNLLSSFAAAMSIANSNKKTNFIFICNNHEEIGSTSASGAQGNMLLSLYERMFPDPQERYQSLAQSLLISIDNAHATHPNSPETHDNSHIINLNHGPVLKINANHRYASTGVSGGIFKILANEVGVKVQEFVMKNDLACGSTIGPMTAAKLGVNTVDVGSASLAMHSIREVTGSKDPYLLYKVIQHFINRASIPEIQSCE